MTHTIQGRVVDVKFSNQSQNGDGMRQQRQEQQMYQQPYQQHYNGNSQTYTKLYNGKTNWNCPKCGNFNYAFRTECKKCNFVRPMNSNGGGGMINPMMMPFPGNMNGMGGNQDQTPYGMSNMSQQPFQDNNAQLTYSQQLEQYNQHLQQYNMYGQQSTGMMSPNNAYDPSNPGVGGATRRNQNSYGNSQRYRPY